MSWRYWEACPSDGGGGPAARYPELTPASGAYAAWALDATAAGGMAADRTGNGRTLTSIQSAVRSSISNLRPPAQGAVWPRRAGSYGAVANSVDGTDFLGEMTATAKIGYVQSDSNAVDPFLEQLVLGFGVAASSHQSAMYITTTGTGTLGMDWSTSLVASTAYAPAAATISEGPLHFLSMQREGAPDYKVRLGVDGTYYESGAMTAPSLVAGSKLRIGAYGYAPFYAFQLLLSDVVLWQSRVSNDDLEARRIIAMGL